SAEGAVPDGIGWTEDAREGRPNGRRQVEGRRIVADEQAAAADQRAHLAERGPPGEVVRGWSGAGDGLAGGPIARAAQQDRAPAEIFEEAFGQRREAVWRPALAGEAHAWVDPAARRHGDELGRGQPGVIEQLGGRRFV